MRFSKFKLLSVLIIGLLIVPSAAPDIGKIPISSSTNPYQMNYSNEELIDEYTWSVMKYCDYLRNIVNNETIYIASPTHGPLLTLTNFMHPELCKIALEVYCENEDGSLNETQTLINLAHYVIKSMCFVGEIKKQNPTTVYDQDVWHAPSIERRAGKKSSSQEMALLGDHFFEGKYDFIGDCGSTSAFITAVLRLCGFSPEKVFEVNIGNDLIYIFNKPPFIAKQGVGHFINLINADNRWFVIDGAMWKNSSNGMIYTEDEKYQIGKLLFLEDLDFYNMTFNITFAINRFIIPDKISLFENDKYFFGYSWGANDSNDVYSNINKKEFISIIDNSIKKVFNNARFEGTPYFFQQVILKKISERTIPHQHMNTISLPYTAKDAIGETIEEKAEYLANLNREFIHSNKNVNGILNQYDKSFYAYGYLNVSFPQAYANAARLAGHTSWFGYTNDSDTSPGDVNATITWIRENIVLNQILNKDQVAFSDLTYILRNGSTVDQAVFAYGVMRNMKQGKDFWSADDLFIIVTNENKGYLAVNISNNGWIYLNFGEGEYIQSYIDNICFAFNENVRLDEWDN